MLKQKILLILCVVLLTACGAKATPTADLDSIQTQAVQTYSAILTQTGIVPPTIELFLTQPASPTSAPIATSPNTLPAVTQPSAAPTKSCYGMAFVSDVTIPDNTPVAPGQAFTKTWKVVNNGSCAWEVGFKFAFTGGDAMSGATYVLPAAVPINGIVDISVVMIAPTNKTGAVRGNWRMSTADGKFFGDEVYVVVTVASGTFTSTATNSLPIVTYTATATATAATATATATSTPTSTATP